MEHAITYVGLDVHKERSRLPRRAGWVRCGRRVRPPVSAATSAMPRSACNACTTGASDHSGSAALMYASRRSRRAVAASTAAIVPPVSLDPVTGLARDQRRSDDDASMSCRC